MTHGLLCRMVLQKGNNMAKGFILIETLLAVALASSVFTSLYILQGSVIKTVSGTRDRLLRVLLCKQAWYQYGLDSVSKKDKTKEGVVVTQAIDYPATTITIEQKKTPKNSGLEKIEGLYIQRIEASWKAGGKTMNDASIGFIYEPPS